MASTQELILRIRERGVSTVTGALGRVAGTLGRIVGIGGALSAAGIGAGLLKVARDAMKSAVEIDRLAKITGASTDTVQRLDYALKQEHGSIESLVPAFRALTRAATYLTQTNADGTPMVNEYSRAIEQLGINVIDPTTKKVREFDAILLDLARAYESSSDKAAFFGYVQQLLGRGAENVLPMIKLQEKGIKSLFAEFDRSGAAFSEEQIKKAKAADDAWTAATTRMRSVVVDNMDSIIAAFEAMTGAVEKAIKLYEDLTGKTLRQKIADKIKQAEAEDKPGMKAAYEIRQRWQRPLTSAESMEAWAGGARTMPGILLDPDAREWLIQRDLGLFVKQSRRDQMPARHAARRAWMEEVERHRQTVAESPWEPRLRPGYWEATREPIMGSSGEQVGWRGGRRWNPPAYVPVYNDNRTVYQPGTGATQMGSDAALVPAGAD